MTLTRTLAVLAALAGALAGCGGDDGRAPAGADAETALRVGLVVDAGQLNDRGFNQLAYDGVKRAERRLGIRGRVFESRSAADDVQNMSRLARQRFDLVVGVGFAQGEAVDLAASRYRRTRFAIVDVDHAALEHRPKNVVGLVFREQQIGYLVGYLAGLMEKRRPGRDVIGSVAGFKEPPVDRFIAGYQAGARKAAPGIRLLNSYSNDWDDQAKCKELALNQIASGAGVVFQVAGGCGLGALDAARERGVWGIGVDADQSFLGPHVLTSAMKKVDRAVFLTIRSIRDGSWQGGRNAVFGLAEGGVGLGKVSDKVPREYLRELERIERQIVAGKVRVPKTLE